MRPVRVAVLEKSGARVRQTAACRYWDGSGRRSEWLRPPRYRKSHDELFLPTVPLTVAFLATCAGTPRATRPSATAPAAASVKQTGFGLGIDGEVGRIVVVQVAPGSPADAAGKKDLCRVIDRVVPGSPADAAGARPGDGVRGFGGNGDPQVEPRYHLRSPERAWTLRGWRNGSGGYEAALRVRANACVSDLSTMHRTRVEKDNAASVARIGWLVAERQFAVRAVVTGAVCSSDRIAAVACQQRTFPDSDGWVDKIVEELGEELRLIPAHRPDPVRVALAINAWYRKLEHVTRGHGGRDLAAAVLAPYARLLDVSGLQAALEQAGASREVAAALVIGVREARPRLDALAGDEGQRVFDAWRQHAKKQARSWARLDVIEERARTATDSAAILEDLDRYREEVLTELGRTLHAFADPRMRRATDLALDVADRGTDPAR